MPPELEQMRDIAYLTNLKSWPPGDLFWYVMLGFLLFCLCSFVSYKIYKKYQMTDKYITKNYLDELLLNFETDPDGSVKLFTEELRKCAIKKYGREKVASLIDASWIDWLNKNKAGNINWNKYADIVLNAPYRQPGISVCKVPKSEFKVMVKALKRWL